MPGTLHVVATPLGNAQDLSPRARAVIEAVACLYCEDTRTTGALLRHLGLRAKELRSLHSHNEDQRVQEILRRLQAGADLALCSDAGTPAISDPGTRVVAAAHEAGCSCTPVAGPSAVAALLSVAGLPASRYRFLGFLGKSRGAQRKALAAALRGPEVAVLYLPMRDSAAILSLVAELAPEALCVLGRELTKVHEELLRMPAAALRDELLSRDKLLGEATLAIWPEAGAFEIEGCWDPARLKTHAAWLLAQGVSRRDAQRALAELTGRSKRETLGWVLEADEAAPK